MTAAPQAPSFKDFFNAEIEERNPMLRIGHTKRLKKELPELNEATSEAQVLAHALYSLSTAADPTIHDGNDCLERLRVGGIRSILNKLNSSLEALGV